MDISVTPETLATTQASGPVVVDVSRTEIAFEDFYRDHADTVARALAVTLGDSELAADATNEAMTRAYQRWSKISRYNNPAGWVYRVGLNWSLSWKRRRRRERDQPVALATERSEVVMRDDSMDAAVDQLSLEHRAVLVCRIYLDWSVEQTAEALEVAPGTVKSRLSRAVAQLRPAAACEGAKS